MPLSANEIWMLNEIARETAQEDPDYVRRLMTYGGSRRGAGTPRRPRRVPTFRDLLWSLRSARALVPLLLVGIVLIAGVVGSSLVAMNSADTAHVRPDGPNARLQP
ncbi:hypothetical protein [Actinomadura sp. 9N407]|uniref:hypothetical protein n=1 Tax=Actinomadura sp. 9N407 TaxID=3375154 RepID=UPI0037976517